MPPATDPPTASPARRRWLAVVEVALILLVFAAQAAWPAPDPNEPHYLGKAKHFWNPAWGQGDFFFDSSDTHRVFYWTAGWLSRFMSLAAMAWVGRIVTWLLLAIAWRRLSFTLVPVAMASVLSAAAFLVFNVCGHMAGEWVVGGFEAKGFAYALVWFALGSLARGRWNTAWLLLGAASSFHVLVGGWSVVAVGFCWLAGGMDRPRLSKMLPSLIGGLLLALPGLWPALALTWNVEPAVTSEANQIYVYERLRHHLTPGAFQGDFLIRHGALVAVWLLVTYATRRHRRLRTIQMVVAGAVAISAVGLAISVATRNEPAMAASVLRYYWFRLADVMVPVGVALGGLRLVVTATRPRWAVAATLAGLAALVAMYPVDFVVISGHSGVPRADKPGKVRDYADWLDVCQFVVEHTPADARFITPRAGQTFKWRTGRAEVVTIKDIPQDAPAIVEWWRRMRDLHETGRIEPRWYHSLADRLEADLRRLSQEYDAQYLLTAAEPPLAFECLHRNASYAVYRIGD